MTTIGLTGGVGSGKSTVARMFAERGALVIDADAVAREVVEPGTPTLAALVERFGTAILAADGSLDRPALAALAFADPAERAALGAITHPAIGARTAELMATARPDQIIVHDVPLLVENGLAPAYDLVVVVWAPLELRLARLEARGMAPDEARRRMSHQASDDERADVADLIIQNDGDLAGLADQVAEVWQEVLSLRR